MSDNSNAQDDFLLELETEFSAYLALRHRAVRYHDTQAQQAVDRWLDAKEPALKCRAQELGVSYALEVARITSTYRPM